MSMLNSCVPRWLVVAVLIIGLVFLPGGVYACTCTDPGPPAVELELVDAVFQGVALNAAYDGEFKTTFQISRVWKGPTGEAIDVYTLPEGICGLQMDAGEEYIVYAEVPARTGVFPLESALENELHTYCWSRTRIASTEDIDELGAPIWERENAATFARGESNGDGQLDISDAIVILNYLFSGSVTVNCQKSGDVNDDGALDVSDGIAVLLHLFVDGPPPASPFGECGLDPTADLLGCASVPACAGS